MPESLPIHCETTCYTYFIVSIGAALLFDVDVAARVLVPPPSLVLPLVIPPSAAAPVAPLSPPVVERVAVHVRGVRRPHLDDRIVVERQDGRRGGPQQLGLQRSDPRLQVLDLCAVETGCGRRGFQVDYIILLSNHSFNEHKHSNVYTKIKRKITTIRN